MSRLVLSSELLNQLRAQLLSSPEEACAVLFGRPVIGEGGMSRIVVRDIRNVADTDYLQRSPVAAQLRPEFVAEVTQRAKRNNESIIFVHSHPFALNSFSAIDDMGERVLAEFLSGRMPGSVHAAMLVTPEVTIARILGTSRYLKVTGVGASLLWGTYPETSGSHEVFDRQVRAFGQAGQQRLAELKVGVVGLGGTGSIVVEQLARLGVRRFRLIDPDLVEQTNLNRLVGAAFTDIGRPKVEVAANQLQKLNPSVEIDLSCRSVLMSDVAKTLVDTDFVFCCTDSQGSRAVLNQFAYQYLVPIIDMGVAVIVSNQLVTQIAGRVQMLAPGLGCLVCGNLLDPEAVRLDLLTEFERSADPYIVGFHEPAPAVISLNGTVASLAVTMFLSATLGVPGEARLINYNGISGTARPAMIHRHPTCISCSARYALARADEWQLPGRLT